MHLLGILLLLQSIHNAIWSIEHRNHGWAAAAIIAGAFGFYASQLGL